MHRNTDQFNLRKYLYSFKVLEMSHNRWNANTIILLSVGKSACTPAGVLANRIFQLS